MVEFNFSATAIGSLPHTEPQDACRLILDKFPLLPFWPQLPKRSFYEGMVTQFSSGLPGIIIDESNKKICMETKRCQEGLESFYEQIIRQNLDYFAISPAYASGLHKMLGLVEKERKDIKYLKGHITGPITFGLALTDENGQAIIHNEIFSDVVIKCLLMKALWQVREIRKLDLEPIIFLDEPSLMQYGSAYLPVNRPTVENCLAEILNALQKEKALTGIHCCGNTDWGILMGLPVDIISFDAYGFMDKFILYHNELNDFIQRGGIIAWGLIPSSEIKESINAEKLIVHLQKGIRILIKKGLDKKRLLTQSLLTPSCGLGALSKSEAEKRIDLLIKTSFLLNSENSGII